MNRKFPPLHALQSFEVASRVLSFTRAAEELHVTPAAVSHRIKTLEERLGLSLFRRENNRILLTDGGEAYISAVREALEMIADATARITEPDRSSALSLSLLPTFTVRWLIPRLGTFQRFYPSIEVRLSTSYRAVDFAREAYDAAVRYGQGTWDGLKSYRLFNEELVPVCSPKLVRGPNPLRRPEDLARFTLLHSATCPENWSIWLGAAGAPNLESEGGLRFDSCLLTLQAAQDGLGIVAANREYVALDLSAGRLVAPFDFTVRKDAGWYFVCPEATTQEPKIVAFRNWLLDQTVEHGALGEGPNQRSLV